MAEATTAPSPSSAPATDAEVITRSGINWGGVIKGVAVVAAVAVAAVAVYSLAAPAAASALSWASTNSILGPIMNSAVMSYHWLAGFGGEIAASLASAVGISGGTAAATAAYTAAPAVTAAIPPLSEGAGLLVAGGTAALGASAAAHTLAHTPLVDPTHAAPPPAHAGVDEAALNSLMASKTAAVNSMAANHTAASLHAQHDAMHQAAELAHHSTHHLHAANHVAAGHAAAAQPADHQPDIDSPDAPDEAETRARNNISRAVRADQSWADKVGSDRVKRSIAPRDESYRMQAEADRLDAALADHDR